MSFVLIWSCERLIKLIKIRLLVGLHSRNTVSKAEDWALVWR